MKYPAGTKLKCVGCKDCGVIATVDNQTREWDWDTDWQPVAPALTLDLAQVPAMGRFPPQAGDVWTWCKSQTWTFTGERTSIGEYPCIDSRGNRGLFEADMFRDMENAKFVHYGSPVAAITPAPAPKADTVVVSAEVLRGLEAWLPVPGDFTIGVDRGRPAGSFAAMLSKERGPGIAAKSLTPEPWRPSVDELHWIPDVGEHGERKP